MDRFRSALVCLKSSGRYLLQRLLGQAIDYALSQWPTLDVFLREGRIEIDNNLVENAIRPTALGKTNWLFIEVLTYQEPSPLRKCHVVLGERTRLRAQLRA